jgi:hypothetical protein
MITDTKFKFYCEEGPDLIYTYHQEVVTWGEPSNLESTVYGVREAEQYIKKGWWVVVGEDK